MAQQIVGVTGGMLFQISAQRQQTLGGDGGEILTPSRRQTDRQAIQNLDFQPFPAQGSRAFPHGRRDQGIGQPTPQRRRQGGQQEQTGQRAEHPQQIGSGAMGRGTRFRQKSRRRLLKPKQDGLAMVHLAIVANDCAARARVDAHPAHPSETQQRRLQREPIQAAIAQPGHT